MGVCYSIKLVPSTVVYNSGMSSEILLKSRILCKVNCASYNRLERA